MVKGVIFDMDGLMFDTERLWDTLWEPACAALGLPLPAEYDRDEFADHRHGAVFPRCCLRYGGRPQQARTRYLFGRGEKAAP